ncbi:MAG: hypothetical protein GF346_06130 [Candidatus Eisenbacteria bacterium]|nr:hypothetical protein [Candidatus Latescibacterota bacterium]MBD3302003.1 hypothetical protein [Candidatus Eisenbacteria bacterium]
MFLDRKIELQTLTAMAQRPGAQFLVLFGRRRVGKTELLHEFCRRHRSAFFVADQRPAGLQLPEFSAMLWSTAGESGVASPTFGG